MIRILVAVLAVWNCLWAQSSGKPPIYSQESIANLATNTAGPFAPNVIGTIYGKDLSWTEEAISVERMRAGALPTELANVRVLIGKGDGGSPVPLFFVSPGQVNFLIPASLIPGKKNLTLVRQGVRGAVLEIPIGEVAPVFYLRESGIALAAHLPGFEIVTQESPAAGGEWIALFAAGLGRTTPPQIDGKPEAGAAPLARLQDLRITLAGQELDPRRISYAGAAPGFVGLYQINVQLPDSVPPDPEVRLSIGGQTSPTGVKLPLR